MMFYRVSLLILLTAEMSRERKLLHRGIRECFGTDGLSHDREEHARDRGCLQVIIEFGRSVRIEP